MLSYALRRLLGAAPTIFVIITVAFFMMRIAPGGPFDQERTLEAVVMHNLNETFGLSDPLWKQYLNYLWNLAHGDLGPSFVYRDFSVGELIATGLPVSIQLGSLALLLALVVGGILGIVASLNQNSALDHLVIAIATFGITVPNFVVAPLLSLVFGVWLGVLPAGGWQSWSPAHMALPVITLALPQVAVIGRLIRASMLEAMRSDHIRTARAYGLPRRMVVITHALRGAALPVVSYLGPAAAALLTGSVVVETIFGIPGIGRYFVQGALNRDYTLVMGTVVVVAVFIVVFNLLVDLAYAWLDPRVRYE